MDVWRPFRRPFREASATFIFASARASSKQELPRSRFFSIYLEVLPRSHRELPRKLFLGVAWKCVICICWWAGHSGWAFWQCFWLYWLASQKHILYQSNTFRFRTSQMMGSGSFNASAWKVCFREASAKNMNTFPKNIPRSWPPCVHHSSCKTYCRYITSYKAQYVIGLYRQYLCMMRIWNVKDKITNPAKHTSAKLQH